jgi:hypothetical protein
MNKLVLIGNGFDLAHDLKTKYTDFLLWYINKVFRAFKSSLNYDDGLMKMFGYRNFPENMAEFLTVTEFLEQMNLYHGQGVTYGFHHPFFTSLIKKNHKNNWVDIEAHYYIELIKLYKKTESPNYTGDLYYIENDVDKLNTCFELIKKQLSEYLTEIDGYAKQKNAEIDNHISSLIRTTHYNNFRNLTNPSAGPQQEIHFLNFNYTSTIEQYIDAIEGYVDKNAIKDFCKINYIHGKLNDKDNPIIFGYGDEMDSYYKKIETLNSNKFLQNIKSFGYFRTGNYQSFSSLINYKGGRFEVHVMGHSCGLSDRILLNSIFEHPNCVSIKIYYHQKSETENDFFEKTQEISRHFTAKGKEKMRTTIVSFQDSKPLTSFSRT